MPASPSHRQQITNAFIKELEAFKAGGYKFKNGSDKYLFEGTQREAFNAYLDGLKNKKLKGYFEIPTGVGKTAIFIAIISCYLKATKNMPDAPRVLIHEPTDDLVNQTALAFADFMPEITSIMEGKDDEGRRLDYENSQIHVKAKGAKSDARIVITTYQGQAADERRGTFEWQVSNLRRAINNKQKVSNKNREEIFRVICEQFPESAVRKDLFTHAQSKPLVRFIRDNCDDPDPLQAFLDAIQPHLDDANPIKEYNGQLKEKDKDKTYKPEDFHLIIHDEAHYVTGKKFGAAVNKFPDALQLGVTATPEYSEENAVVNKLKNLYYYLPLTTIKEGDKVIKEGAIERGDCCPVCPILIKTRPTENDKHRLALAKRLIAQQHGKHLSDGNLQLLYNQAARNQAVIKAYLRGKHPITGERYLGKTGMIFATGIQHCKDFITHAEAVLNQPAYREVKNWLRDKGLCLIAPIHSDIPEEGIKITIGGKKKLCTKDEIKELHRKGKVLLLISDKELALGTDYPQDEFGAELGDRFTKPDAAQRFGRIIRVDRGNKRLELKANPDKWAAWFNVMDETTHEQYKGTSHYPIHGIEILNGVVHRPKQRRHIALTRFVPQVGVDEKLGFDFVHEEEALKGVARKFQEGKKKKLPDKTDDDLTLINQVPAELKIHYTNPQYVIWRTQVERDVAAGKTVEVGGYRVLQMQAGANKPYCLDRKAIPALAEELNITLTGELPKKTRDDLELRKEVPKGLNLAPSNSQYMEWRIQAEAQLEAGKTVKVGGYSILQMRSGPKKPYCLNRKALPALAKEISVTWTGKLPIKTPDDLTLKREVPEELRTDPRNRNYMVWRTKVEVDLAQGKTVKVGGYPIVQMQAGPKKPYCLNKLAIPALREELARMDISGPGHADENLKRKPPTKQNRTPGSEDLKRKGRSRGITDDES